MKKRGEVVAQPADAEALPPAALAEIARPIRDRWQAAALAIVETGLLLIEARANLPHGQFESMVESELPFGASTARMLMAIARHEWLANRQHVDVLPPAWSTLYELSRLPGEALQQAFSDGLIRPDMERSDAKLLRHPSRPESGAVAPLPAADSGYGLILGDPAWQFGTWSERGQTRGADRHYPTMTAQEIAALPVGDLAADHAVLVLWGTWPLAPLTLATMEAWGFTYVTGGGWFKSSPTGRRQAFGTGYVLRNACDPFFVGTRGQPRTNGSSLRNAIDGAEVEGPIREHSRKPESIYELCEALVPRGPYLELFARQRRPGWDSWGNETDKFEATL